MRFAGPERCRANTLAEIDELRLQLPRNDGTEPRAPLLITVRTDGTVTVSPANEEADWAVDSGQFGALTPQTAQISLRPNDLGRPERCAVCGAPRTP